jgi:predicted Zn-dependent protease
MMRIKKIKFMAIAGLGLLAGCVSTVDPASVGTGSKGETTTFDLAADVLDESPLVPGRRPTLDSLEGSLWMQIDNAEHQIKSSGHVIRDPALNKYVRGVVCNMAGKFCPHIRTYIVRAPSFNASMFPNGVMQVHSGLLLRVRNEAELAAILGHEIGHYIRLHTRDRWRKIIDTTNVLMFTKMVFAVAGVPGTTELIDNMARGSLAAYSRDHERESDMVGLRLLVKNGYDPWAAQKVWVQIERERQFEKKNPFRSKYLDSHPSGVERADNLGALARYAEKHTKNNDRGKRRFEDAVIPLRAMMLRDEMNLRDHKRFRGLLAMLIRNGRHVGIFHFFRGENYRLQGGDDNLDKAMLSYRNAAARRETPVIVYRAMARVLAKQGKKAEARKAYRLYLDKSPDAEDRGIIEQIMDGLS